MYIGLVLALETFVDSYMWQLTRMFQVKGSKFLKLVHHSFRVEVKIRRSGQFLHIEDSEFNFFMHRDAQI